MFWLLGPFMGIASERPLQAAFKPAPCRFVIRFPPSSTLESIGHLGTNKKSIHIL
ncbi:hypothetical protein YPPY46_1100 [Yersinia pestis PY-46]|nr:hypothetical protein YPPY07_1028 [Yersinia pestis PY-07]EIR93598.1 hypothetical protein YPPY36_1276 [Yersinia pestis PY-36]EIS08548.1 hypothetical protein YPPY46_1100 [Yersinia pestis PY-46]EIS32543.1 hypothetical protein YPPY55_1119 [Yersinia pestis PY-55]EIS96496.1 hypothetical protein YPPY88_1087 [Yersinia pestis PY-88]EIT18577.1 hypothetical protein YPPY93_1149 [Yersinia pestis PY-93]EIT31464.1 hypothetical protein YPPY95_1160 [Yersinia pestis PY-95]EIT34717.1 hypothetical protein YPP